MSGLLSPQQLAQAEQSATFQAIGRLLAEPNPRPVNVFGLSDTGKAVLTLLWQSQAEHPPLIYLAPDILRARSLAHSFKALRGKAVPCLLPAASDFVGRGTKSRTEEIKRLGQLSAFLEGEENLLLVSGPALLDHLPSPQYLKYHSLFLKPGQTYDFRDLIEKLSRMGYQRLPAVDAQGQFSVRGDLLDIGVSGSLFDRHEESCGIRLSFFDQELESIRLFSLESQRSEVDLDEVNLAPLRQNMLSDQERADLAEKLASLGRERVHELALEGVSKRELDHLQTWIDQDYEDLKSGLQSAGMARWDFLMADDVANLFDYAKTRQAWVLVEEPQLLRQRLDGHRAEFNEEVKGLLTAHDVLPQVAESRFRPADIFRGLAQYRGPRLALSNLAASGNGLPGGSQFQLRTAVPENYQGRSRELFADLKTWQKQDVEISLSAPTPRLKKSLRDLLLRESFTLPIAQSDLSEGVIFPDLGLVYLGSENLFGRSNQRRRKAKAKGSPINFLSDIKPGDLVVHEVHGIARYLGLTSLDNQGFSRDYLHLDYAGDDSLYIPVDQLDQIQRYVGTGDRKPPLSKLGSPDWEKKKAKALASARKLAVDLLAVYQQRQLRQGFVFAPDTPWQQEFEARFPYVETDDQLEAMTEIKKDMESPKIMDRLLCGDVGFGKTELAFRAIFKAVMNGKQAAMIVPTTVLAQQHYHSFLERMRPYPLRVALLSRAVTPQLRKQLIHDLAQGQIDVIIGTHSVLNKQVKFSDLGLLVIDEEQRFGVDQKESIKERYPQVDVLTLTATPIPRTLHMAVSGVRDISYLSEGPENRRPVQTYVMEYDPAVIDEAILREISRQGQIFYICNNIQKLSGKYKELSERLPGAKIRLAHGRMPEGQIENTISDFLAGDFDILLCTTIVESGIDMPNVNTLIVERADRMGLAQLYQLRGRTGRSSRQAYAYITYPADKVLPQDAQKRLAAIRDFTELGSGLHIALRDLEVRGAGTFLGAEQSGQMGNVGYDLYCRMLEQSLQEARGIEPVPVAPVTVMDIQLDAGLPGSYIEDEGMRMDIYKRILDMTNEEDWHDVLDELLDRFGDPPQTVMNLLDISYARVKATQDGFSRIREEGDDLVLYISEKNRQEALLGLLQNPYWQGRLHLNAGYKPRLVMHGAAHDPDQIGKNLRLLWML